MLAERSGCSILRLSVLQQAHADAAKLTGWEDYYRLRKLSLRSPVGTFAVSCITWWSRLSMLQLQCSHLGTLGLSMQCESA